MRTRPALNVRRVGALGGAVVLLASLSLAQAPAANAGVLPSSTTLSVSPSTSYVGTAVTMTSTVSLLGLPGLGITPTGTITFRYDAGTTHLTIGSNTVGCLLTTCTVSRSTSSLPAGSGTITATYSGDTVLAGSSTSAPVTVNYYPDPPPAQSASNGCGAGQTCTTPTIQVSDSNGNTDKLTVTASSSSGSQNVTAALTPGATLDCPLQSGDSSTGQALATVNNTGADASKSVVYRIDGPASVTLHNNYANSTDRLVCFASPNPFNGWSPSGYGPAPLYTTPYGQYYEAELGSCVNHSGYKPCFQLLDGSALASPYVEITVNTQPGDPKILP